MEYEIIVTTEDDVIRLTTNDLTNQAVYDLLNSLNIISVELHCIKKEMTRERKKPND